MKAIILAAGYATRLWPLTLNKPKPLLPIGEKPLLEHIMGKLNAIGDIDEIFIVTNTKFVKNFQEWEKNYSGAKEVCIIDDGIKSVEERRGSVGDVIFAIEEKAIDSDFIVIAGDNLFDFRIDDFIDRAKENSPYATIGLYDIKNMILAKKYGIVELDNNSKIISFNEKPQQPRSSLAAMCLYYFPKEKLALLKRYRAEKRPLDLAGSFIKWLSETETVYGYIFEGNWLDIGDKKSLSKAQKIAWS